MTIRKLGLPLIILLFVAAAACGPMVQPANVSSVTVQETDGGHVAVVEGEHADACGAIGTTFQHVDGNTLQVGMTLAPVPADMMCAAVITPYTETVPLDTQDLAPGSYDVVVNGVATTLEIGSGDMAESANHQSDEPPLLANVTGVDVVQDGDAVSLTISGDLPDACHEVSNVSTAVDGSDISVTVEMVVPDPTLMCAQMITPFEVEAPIEEPLEPGEYTVTANEYTTDVTVE